MNLQPHTSSQDMLVHQYPLHCVEAGAELNTLHDETHSLKKLTPVLATMTRADRTPLPFLV